MQGENGAIGTCCVMRRIVRPALLRIRGWDDRWEPDGFGSPAFPLGGGAAGDVSPAARIGVADGAMWVHTTRILPGRAGTHNTGCRERERAFGANLRDTVAMDLAGTPGQ